MAQAIRVNPTPSKRGNRGTDPYVPDARIRESVFDARIAQVQASIALAEREYERLMRVRPIFLDSAYKCVERIIKLKATVAELERAARARPWKGRITIEL